MGSFIHKDNFRAERERQRHAHAATEQFAARDRSVRGAVIDKVKTIGAACGDALNLKIMPVLAGGRTTKGIQNPAPSLGVEIFDAVPLNAVWPSRYMVKIR